MEPRDYARLLRRHWITVMAIAVAVVCGCAVVTASMTPKYTSTTQLFFTVTGTESISDLAQGSSYTEAQMTSYSKVAVSPFILDPVIAELGLSTTSTALLDQVQADVVPNTAILQITVESVTPEQAAALATAISKQLQTNAGRLAPKTTSGSASVQVTLLAPASVPSQPSSPAVARNLALAVPIGLLLGCGAALARRGADGKIRNEADVADLTDIPVLGLVPFDRQASRHAVIMTDHASSARAEALRRLRINLQYIGDQNRAKSIVVTSSIAGEGKTQTAINLALSAADGGLRVLLIDADLQRPSVARLLCLDEPVGLSSLLTGESFPSRAVQHWLTSGLDVLPAGPVATNSAELLGSSAMSSLLQRFTSNYDMVLIDSSPLLPVPDAIALGKAAGGIVVVTDVNHVRRSQFLEALRALRTVDSNVLGLVLNKVARQETGGYGLERATPDRVGRVLNLKADPENNPAQAGTAPLSEPSEPFDETNLRAG